MRQKRPRHTITDVLNALEATQVNGAINLTWAAERLGCQRQTIANVLERHGYEIAQVVRTRGDARWKLEKP